MEPLKHFWKPIVLFFASLWVGSITLQFLPEGTFFLHIGALFSTLALVIASVFWFVFQMEEWETTNKRR